MSRLPDSRLAAPVGHQRGRAHDLLAALVLIGDRPRGAADDDGAAHRSGAQLAPNDVERDAVVSHAPTPDRHWPNTRPPESSLPNGGAPVGDASDDGTAHSPASGRHRPSVDRFGGRPSEHTMPGPGDVDAPDRVARGTRERFVAELRARALGRRYGIVSPPVRPERWTGERAPDGAQSVASWAPRYAELRVAAGAGCELWEAGCEEWIRVPDELAPGAHVALAVRGGSMAPLLADGEVVLVRLGGEARRGRVVVARHEHAGFEAGYVVKAVEAVRDGVVRLASLAPEHAGLAVPDDGRHVLGTVVARWEAM